MCLHRARVCGPTVNYATDDYICALFTPRPLSSSSLGLLLLYPPSTTTTPGRRGCSMSCTPGVYGKVPPLVGCFPTLGSGCLDLIRSAKTGADYPLISPHVLPAHTRPRPHTHSGRCVVAPCTPFRQRLSRPRRAHAPRTTHTPAPTQPESDLRMKRLQQPGRTPSVQW